MTTIKSLFIGLILFTTIILSGIGLLNYAYQADPTSIDISEINALNNTLVKMDELNSSIYQIKTNMEGTAGGGLNELMTASWGTISLLFDTLIKSFSIFGGVATYLQIPTYIFAMMLLVLIVVIAFSIYSAIFRVNI